MKRDYPEHPLVGVGAVIVDAGRVLLARRGRPPLLGRWSIPGGLVELGETLRVATAREALEETGLVVEVGEVLEVLDRIVPGEPGENARPRYHYVLIDFLCRVTAGEPRAGGDATEIAWAAEADLPRYELEPVAIDVIRKAFSGGPG